MEQKNDLSERCQAMIRQMKEMEKELEKLKEDIEQNARKVEETEVRR